MAEARDRDITQNRRAFHDYHIDERIEAGLSLIGSEVKSLRDGRAQLKDSYARFFGDELFLVGAHISPYAPSSQFGHEPERNRKLLLHRSEIDKLEGKVQEKGLTLVPTKMYFKGGRIKVEIGVAKGKKLYDKRETEKRREADREARAMMKSKGR